RGRDPHQRGHFGGGGVERDLLGGRVQRAAADHRLERGPAADDHRERGHHRGGPGADDHSGGRLDPGAAGLRGAEHHAGARAQRRGGGGGGRGGELHGARRHGFFGDHRQKRFAQRHLHA